MKTDFFYSKSTKLYISRKPLKIDSRVKKAAEKLNMKLSWDDEGRINFADFDRAKKLLSALGSTMLSPIEYWLALKDAEKEKDADIIKELMSNRYCEWLDRVYLIDKTWIDHPKIVRNYKYSGEKKKAVEPIGTPGWFNPENNINFKLGIPKKVELFRGKFATSWKYWSPDFSITKHRPRAIIRGYVTSVGKPSFDQGIPVDAQQPMQMIRECRKQPLESPIKIEILDSASKLLKQYARKKRNFNSIVGFLNKYGKLFRGSKQLIIYKIRERIFDLLGSMKIEAIAKGSKREISILDKAIKTITGYKFNEFNSQDFISFIKNSRQRLYDALQDKKDMVFVMGHKNPDTDTIISCLFESWRNHILDQEKIIYVPVVQNHKVPDEVRALLGDEISNSIVLDRTPEYIKAKQSGLARWISVDQNREPEIQKYFISIIDHHIASEISKLQDLPKTMEIIGSCTALIVQKMLGMGILLDKTLGEFLHGATLMDTENRVFYKMTPKDVLIMNYLKNLSGVDDEENFYGYLMSFLLNTDDPEILFGRDYKEDWGFGFAVAKIKNGFKNTGKEIKKELIKKATGLATQNNINKNLPLTILRITDYEEDNITVNRERIYLVFNKTSSNEFKSAVFNTLEKIIQFEFGKINIKTTPDYIEFWGTGMQLSRKKTAPILEPVVKVFNEYFYSPSTKLWIKRDFLKKSRDVIQIAKKLKLKITFDEEQRVHYITYPEAKLLSKNMGFEILALREYWQALKYAKKIKDIQMIESLQGSNFVEFLDTVIKNYNTTIEHPRIIHSIKGYSLSGKAIKVVIPEGKPGLIHPDQIDLKTGIPKEVKPPSKYGNPELWRYWEPDSNLVIPTRSYIFLLKQPCWDGKFHIRDSFPNLGIRPCYKKLSMPKVKANFKKQRLNIKIWKEGDVIEYSFKKYLG